MQLAAFCDLDVGTEQFFHSLGEGLADISTISQDALDGLQICHATPQRQQGAFPVGYVGRRNGDGVRQSLGIHRNVAFDARHLLASIVTFLSRTIGVLDALRVDDQKARRGFAPLSCTGRANHIFLKPVPERLSRLNRVRSTWRSTHAPCAISGIHLAASAIGNHS